MSGGCSAHRGPCPWDCRINGERKWLRLALEFYADPLHYCEDIENEGTVFEFVRSSIVADDKGERARAALNRGSASEGSNGE